MTPAELAHNHVATLGPVHVPYAHRVVSSRLVVGQLLLLVGKDVVEARRGGGNRAGPLRRVGGSGVLGGLDGLGQRGLPGG